jgi:hypothetical protein
MPPRACRPSFLPWSIVAVALALVSATPLLSAAPGAGGAGPRLLAGAFVLGQTLAMGFASALLEAGGRCLCPTRPWVRLALAGLVATALGALVLAPDLENFTLRTVGRDSELPFRGALVLGAALALVAAHALAHAMARRHRAGAALALSGALGLAVANTVVLPGGYPGVHAYLLALAALVARGALGGRAWPSPRPRHEFGRTAPAGLLAVASLFVPPPERVRLALAPLSAAVLADHLPLGTRAPSSGAGEVSVPAELEPHFRRGPAEPPRPPTLPPLLDGPPLVLLLTVDSMRSEVLENPANVARLPTLHRLRDAGYFVPRAVSPSTVTRFTMGSLFTGVNVPSLRWVRDSATQGSLVKENRPRLAERLTAAGVETVHLVTQYELVNVRANAIGRGFTEETVVPPEPGAKLAYAPAVFDALLARLERAAPDRPLFVFSHLMDAHHPWDTGGTEGKPYDRYIGELARVDAQFARLDGFLTERGLWARTVLFVAADHGQAFGQHGWPYHGGAPYEEQIRVPLVAFGPSVRAGRSPCDVPLLDLTPTILDLFGRPTPGDFVGRTLSPALRGGAPVCGRPLYSSTWDMFGLVTPDGRKVIDNRRKKTRELYDLRTDPAETRNLCPDDPAACDAAIGLLGRYLEMQGFITPPK